MRRAIALLALLLISPHYVAAQRLACGGHLVNYVGGSPRMGLAADVLRTEPTIPEPADWTRSDRVLWDGLVFDTFDHWETGVRDVTKVITPDRLASISICQQGPDVSRVGGLMEPYDRAWWREAIRYWSGDSWTGEFVVGDCSTEPEDGWIYVRAGESRGSAHALTWRDYSSGVPHWQKAEIVIWSDYSRGLPVAQSQKEMESTLAHELGHVMGFWHVPLWAGFMMGYGEPDWTPKERDMANLAYRLGPGVQYPGLVRPDDLSPADDVELAERAALTALYDATDGPNWRYNRSWKTAAPLGSWQGVTTNEAGRVTDLAVFADNVTGRLPAELGDLTNLETLILSRNNLTGPIPPELGNLTTLVWLNLADNNLSGPIPPELSKMANLVTVYLSSNNLSGQVPAELGEMANLLSLHLNDNNLSGPLPSSMTNLKRPFTALDIEDNAGLCAPADEEFQAWLATVLAFRGETCAADPDPDPDPDPEPLEVDIVGVPDVAVAGESYELTAQSDEESLVYAWRIANGGSIEPDDEKMVIWTAPATAGTAWIRVDVTHEDGATGGQSAYVRVEVPDQSSLTLSAAPAPAEGGAPVTVTATFDKPAPATGLTVTLTTGGTATLDTDYTLSSTTITLAAGETAGTATITVTDDAEDDDDETIVLGAASTTPALTAEPLTLTIEDNDVTPVPALPHTGAAWLGLLLLGAARGALRARSR